MEKKTEGITFKYTNPITNKEETGTFLPDVKVGFKENDYHFYEVEYNPVFKFKNIFAYTQEEKCKVITALPEPEKTEDKMKCCKCKGKMRLIHAHYTSTSCWDTEWTVARCMECLLNHYYYYQTIS